MIADNNLANVAIAPAESSAEFLMNHLCIVRKVTMLEHTNRLQVRWWNQLVFICNLIYSLSALRAP